MSQTQQLAGFDDGTGREDRDLGKLVRTTKTIGAKAFDELEEHLAASGTVDAIRVVAEERRRRM